MLADSAVIFGITGHVVEICYASRNRSIEGEHPYVYLGGVVLKRSWAGAVRAD